MLLEIQAVGPFFKNGFVIGCEESREAVLIDPGDEVEQLLTFAEQHVLTIGHILLTHAHVDHITGVAAAKRILGAPVYLHRDDLFLYDNAVGQGAMFGLSVQPQPPIDVFYTANQAIAFGKYESAATPYTGPLSRRRLPAGWVEGYRRQEAVRRRYAVRRFDRTDGPARRRLRHADSIDSDGAFRVW